MRWQPAQDGQEAHSTLEPESSAGTVRKKRTPTEVFLKFIERLAGSFLYGG